MMDFTGAVKPLVQQMIFKNPKNSQPRPELNMLYQMQKQKDVNFGFFEQNEEKVHSALCPAGKLFLIATPFPRLSVINNTISDLENDFGLRISKNFENIHAKYIDKQINRTTGSTAQVNIYQVPIRRFCAD